MKNDSLQVSLSGKSDMNIDRIKYYVNIYSVDENGKFNKIVFK